MKVSRHAARVQTQRRPLDPPPIGRGYDSSDRKGGVNSRRVDCESGEGRRPPGGGGFSLGFSGPPPDAVFINGDQRVMSSGQAPATVPIPSVDAITRWKNHDFEIGTGDRRRRRIGCCYPFRFQSVSFPSIDLVQRQGKGRGRTDNFWRGKNANAFLHFPPSFLYNFFLSFISAPFRLF